MKILFITDNFPPEVNAPATRTYEHCIEWVKEGAEVTVVTCFPNFPQGKIYEGYENKLSQVEYVDGIKVIRLWSFITPNTGFFKRILDFISFAVSSFCYLLFRKAKYDIIVATSPQFFTGITAMLIGAIKRKPWVFEVRDLWPEGIIVLKKNSLIYRVLEKLEKKYYKSAKKIITVTNSFKSDIQNRCEIDENKVSVVFNGANSKLFEACEKDQQLVQKLNLEDKFVIGYAGTLGVSHSLDFIFDCMPDIKEKFPNVHFLFIGSGALQQELKLKIDELSLVNVTLLPPVSKDEIVRYVSIFDIGLVPLKNVPAYKKVIPSKIFELSAMRKPILLGVLGEVRDIIEKYQTGKTFIPENKESFIEGIEDLYQERKELNKYHKHLKQMSEDFSRRSMALKMLSLFKETI